MMDRYLGSMFSSQSAAKPEAPKPRRRLQKISAQRPQSVNYSDTKPSQEIKTQRRTSTFNIFSSIKSNSSTTTHRPSLPHSADSEDGTWLQEFRDSGYLCRDGRPSRNSVAFKDGERPKSVVIPEFAHLAMKDEKPVSPQPETKTETDTEKEKEKETPPVVTPAPRQRTLRRYAKTPVLHIGQLETHPLLDTQATSQDVPSIESIAESYRALLESRCDSLNERPVDTPSTPRKASFIAQDTSALPSPLEPVTEIPEPPFPRGTPRSDDGTLVASDGGSVRRRYGSTSPPLTSPSWSSYETAATSPRHSSVEPRREAPDLRPCIDLLMKELSSAFRNKSGRGKGEISALQVWVMIGTYERLRDQVLQSGENHSTLVPMFDSWLCALRSIHNEMTGSDGQGSESDYGD